MKDFDAFELSYKNGYEQGYLDAKKEYEARLKNLMNYINILKN